MSLEDFVDAQRLAYADLAPRYQTIGEQHQRRLWHQLTDTLIEFVSDPETNRGDNLIELYTNFVSKFEEKLNQLRLVGFVAQVASQYYPSRPYNAAELGRAIALLEQLKEKRERLGEEAYLVCLMECTSLELKRACTNADPSAELDTLKTVIEEAKTTLEGFDEAQPIVSATVFRVAAEYHKIRGTAAQYYHYALQYLAHKDLETVSDEERRTLATDIALAALVGEKVFNFGEIVAHPIMTSLVGSPQEWLAQLLRVFHTGDIDGYNTLVAANRAAYDAQPALSANDGTVKEKVAIVCVMELASKRPATDRSISFADIAEATRLPVDHVEWLLMRAMSMGLLKGVMDQVDQVVHVSFIKPRVLDMSQIDGLRNRMGEWSERVKSTLLYIETNTRELFA